MLVVCPGCGARYRITADHLPVQGARARCPKCERVFRVGEPREPAIDPQRGTGPAPPLAAVPQAAVPVPKIAPSVRSTPVIPLRPAPVPLGSRPTSPPARPPALGATGRPGPPLAPSRPAVPPHPARTPFPAREASRPAEPASQAGGPPAPAAPPPIAAHPDPYSTMVPAAPRESLAARIRMARRPAIERPLLISHGYGLGDTPPGTGGSEMPADQLMALSPADLQRIADDMVTALAAAHAEQVAAARQDHRWDAHLGRPIREAWTDYQACVGGSPEGEEHFRGALNRILAGGEPIF